VKEKPFSIVTGAIAAAIAAKATGAVGFALAGRCRRGTDTAPWRPD